MDTKRPKILVIFAASTFFLLSCAAQTPVSQEAWRKEIASVSKADLKYENVIYKKFTAYPTIDDPEATLTECQSTMVAYLKERGLFKKVEELSSGKSYGPSLLVEARLRELRTASEDHRGSGGIFSRRPHIEMSVWIYDFSTGSLIAEQELSRELNPAGPSSLSDLSKDGLPRQMGILVGDFIILRAKK